MGFLAWNLEQKKNINGKTGKNFNVTLLIDLSMFGFNNFFLHKILNKALVVPGMVYIASSRPARAT